MSGALPKGAVDCHCHVFGPADVFPYAADRFYTPDDAPKERLFAMHRRWGFDHAVIVQPTAHGTDNSATLDAIAASGFAYRGVALVRDDVRLDEIAALHRGGMRGVRFHFLSHMTPPPSLDTFRRVTAAVAPFGWHVVLHVMDNDVERLPDYLKDLAIPAVIDHMGRIPAARGLSSRPYKILRDMVAAPDCWIKISGADRISEGPPYHDAIAMARDLVEAAPGRVLWGSDWPHPNFKGTMPQESDLLALLQLVAPEPDLLRQILVDNPSRLYDFSAGDNSTRTP